MAFVCGALHVFSLWCSLLTKIPNEFLVAGEVELRQYVRRLTERADPRRTSVSSAPSGPARVMPLMGTDRVRNKPDARVTLLFLEHQ